MKSTTVIQIEISHAVLLILLLQQPQASIPHQPPIDDLLLFGFLECQQAIVCESSQQQIFS